MGDRHGRSLAADRETRPLWSPQWLRPTRYPRGCKRLLAGNQFSFSILVHKGQQSGQPLFVPARNSQKRAGR